MTEAFLINGVKMILSAVSAQVEREIALAWGAKGELEKLQDKLLILQLVSEDAERRQVKEPSVRVWLGKLKNVAYKAQDVMDDFSYEAIRQEKEVPAVANQLMRQLIDMVLNFCTSSNPILFQLKMAHMIRDINDEFNKIKKEMEEYNFIKENVPLGPYNPDDDVDHRRETTSFTTSSVDASSVVGREAEKSKIVALLTNSAPASEEQERISVLPIVGMGGLGKTTLAQLVYNDKQVSDYFKDLRMWVRVTQDFDVNKLLREIALQSNPSSNDSPDVKSLVREVQRNLGGKHFLLVLDNLWNEDIKKWKRLMKALVCGAKGSKIIVTTRKYEVASLVGTLPTHQLRPLSEYDAWSLFSQKAFWSPRTSKRQDLEMVGRRIVKRCGGVPLALEIIGSQLKSRGENVRAWRYIEESEIWDLPEARGILKALMVSYHSLPSHLKQCFSYCSVFRKGELIRKDTLVQLWMAEGFLTNGNRVVEEEVGCEYADSLLRCCFFQAEEENKWGDDVISFKMHDLVHDLAHSVVSSVDRTSVLVDNVEKNITGTRRLQVAFTGEGASTATHVLGDRMSMISGDQLRVLILRNCFCGIIIMRNVSRLMNLKRLRVLILEGILVENLPNSIADLKQLRYLDISGSKIEVLPSGFTALYNLQTLKLNSCSDLETFPSDFTRKLTNLRHLEMRCNSTPKEISRLRFLQTLPQFAVGKERGRGISELKFLNLLRDELEIMNLENVENKKAARSARLVSKQNIRGLAFTWSLGMSHDHHDEVLEGLQPPRNLHGLKINNFMGAMLPRWLKGGAYTLPYLVEIELQSLVHCAHLPAFGSFPNLRVLYLGEMLSVDCIGDDFYGGTTPPFRSLEKLHIKRLTNLEEWAEAPVPSTFSSSPWSSFPLLEELIIDSCPRLRTTPTLFPMLDKLNIIHCISAVVVMLGTSKLTSLTSLAISNVADLTRVPPSLLSNNKLLQRLEITNCPMLQSFPIEELQCLTALEDLKIGGFPEMLDSFPFLAIPDDEKGGCQLSGVKILRLHNSNVASLPEQMQHFTALEELHVNYLPNIVALPDWLGNLPLLRQLQLVDCPKLMHLPSLIAMQRLTTLQKLCISQCDQLEERCTSDQGEERHKISHIPWVFIEPDINIFQGSRLEPTYM